MKLTKKLKGLQILDGTVLKIIALVLMTCDHVGLQLANGNEVLRALGRLAMPIFAFMIAEGCKYTKNRLKYLLLIAGLGVACQAVYVGFMGSWYMGILITFSFSIILIYALDNAIKKKDSKSITICAIAFATVIFLVVALPNLLPSSSDYAVDYGIFGVFLPVVFYLGQDKPSKLLYGAVDLVLLCVFSDWKLQWFCLLSIAILTLYNGQKGKLRLKYLFYIYYPAHLVVIYLISLLI